MKKFYRYIVPLQAVPLGVAGYMWAADPGYVDYMNKHLPPDSQNQIGIYVSAVSSGSTSSPIIAHVAIGPDDLSEPLDPNIGQRSRPAQAEIRTK